MTTNRRRLALALAVALASLSLGDDALAEAAASTEPRPAVRRLEEILAHVLDLARRFRGFDVVRTIGSAPNHVTAVVRPVAQPERLLRISMAVESNPPHRIEGLFLLPAADEDLPQDVERSSPEAAVEAFRNEVDRAIADGVFAGVVLLARGPDVIVRRAAGEADREHRVPITENTVFSLASMSKMFTAVAIAKLVESGRVAWTDPVGRHLKGWLPDALAGAITVDQLLTHTSGLGDYLERIPSDAAIRDARSLASYRDLVRAATIEGKPEDGLRYGNTGYVVLGALIEAVTGRDDFEFVRREVR